MNEGKKTAKRSRSSEIFRRKQVFVKPGGSASAITLEEAMLFVNAYMLRASVAQSCKRAFYSVRYHRSSRATFKVAKLHS